MLYNTFIVVVPVYNAEDLIEACLKSVLMQKCSDCGVIIRDDMSTDHTPERIYELIGIDGVNQSLTKCCGKDVMFLRNSMKYYGGGNAYDSVINYVGNQDAIVGVVDGDDRLTDEYALEKVLSRYVKKDAWLVWSQHQAKSLVGTGKTGYSRPLPPDEMIYTHRDYWAVSHFGTCRAWLYHHIDSDSLRDPFHDDLFCRFCADATINYAMMEMCGNRRADFIQDILYFYNDDLPLNDHNKAKDQVQKYTKYIRVEQKRYKQLG